MRLVCTAFERMPHMPSHERRHPPYVLVVPGGGTKKRSSQSGSSVLALGGGSTACWGSSPTLAAPQVAGGMAPGGGATCGASSAGSDFAKRATTDAGGGEAAGAVVAASQSPGTAAARWGVGLPSRLVRFAGVEGGSSFAASRLAKLPGLLAADDEEKRAAMKSSKMGTFSIQPLSLVYAREALFFE